MNPIPRTPSEWLAEILSAFEDAAETVPFARLLGQQLEESEYFHLAPEIVLKYRGIARSRRKLAMATDAALATYVVNIERDVALCDPLTAFALCYLAAHIGLGLVTEDIVEAAMISVENRAGRRT